MKRILAFIFFVFLGCDKDSNDNDTNSDCQNPDYVLISWTIIDNSTEKKIAGAGGLLYYGDWFSEFIMFGSTSSGVASFCFPYKGVIFEGVVRADGYKELDLTGMIASDISLIRLTPLD